MFTLLAGISVFVATVAIFFWLRPRGGRMHRLVGTELEPYIAVAVCAGLALGFTMSLSGLITLYGG